MCFFPVCWAAEVDEGRLVLLERDGGLVLLVEFDLSKGSELVLFEEAVMTSS